MATAVFRLACTVAVARRPLSSANLPARSPSRRMERLISPPSGLPSAPQLTGEHEHQPRHRRALGDGLLARGERLELEAASSSGRSPRHVAKSESAIRFRAMRCWAKVASTPAPRGSGGRSVQFFALDLEQVAVAHGGDGRGGAGAGEHGDLTEDRAAPEEGEGLLFALDLAAHLGLPGDQHEDAIGGLPFPCRSPRLPCARGSRAARPVDEGVALESAKSARAGAPRVGGGLLSTPPSTESLGPRGRSPGASSGRARSCRRTCSRRSAAGPRRGPHHARGAGVNAGERVANAPLLRAWGAPAAGGDGRQQVVAPQEPLGAGVQVATARSVSPSSGSSGPPACGRGDRPAGAARPRRTTPSARSQFPSRRNPTPARAAMDSW